MLCACLSAVDIYRCCSSALKLVSVLDQYNLNVCHNNAERERGVLLFNAHASIPSPDPATRPVPSPRSILTALGSAACRLLPPRRR